MVGKVTDDTALSCSQLPAVLGVSPYDTANSILDKVRRARLGEDVRVDIKSEAADWGNTLEPMILAEAARRLGMTWAPVSDKRVHATLPLQASLDGIIDAVSLRRIENDPSKGIYVVGADYIDVNGFGAFEAKLTGNDPEDTPALHRGPIQMQGQMMCAGLGWGALAVLYRGTELRIFLFAAHLGSQLTIAKAVKEFEAHLEAGTHYPLHGSDANIIYPTADAEPAIELPDMEDLAERYIALKDQIKQGEEALELISLNMKEALGNHEKGIAGRFEIKWPMRNYKAQPEKVTPAKPAYSVRQSNVTVKEVRK